MSPGLESPEPPFVDHMTERVTAARKQLKKRRHVSMSNVLVTGSSSGFGNLTALALARRGHTVFATMRDPQGRNRAPADELVQVAKAQKLAIHVLDLDVTSDRSVQAAVDDATTSAGSLA